jgi:thiamine-phosphate pyrophosphorylase
LDAPRVYLIADAARAGAVPPALSALPAGMALVQLRDKRCAPREILRLARELLPACRARGAPLLINDRADIALAAGAQGVHLPGGGLTAAEARALLGPDALIGVSCHTVEEVEEGSRTGADFCVFGPVWDVPGKGRALGPGVLAAAVRASAIPVLALGGVDPHTAPLARAAGACGVACIRSVLDANEPAAAARALWRSLAR